ncbi:MAG: mechanosensitive ion channel domain-containing protein [Cyanobacteria bacterium P01_H01_bin.35]
MASYTQHLQEPGFFPSDSVRQQEKQMLIFAKRAKECLDLSKVPVALRADAASQRALLLKEILDRIQLPPYAEIPDAEAVAAQELSTWRIPNTEIDITKVEEGLRTGEFLFSPETVANLERFYQLVKEIPYKPGSTEGFYEFYMTTPGQLFPSKWLDGIPSWLETAYWGQTLWQWISLGILLPMAFWIAYISFTLNFQRLSVIPPPRRTWEMLLSPLMAIATFSMVGYLLGNVVNLTGSVFLIIVISLEISFWIVLGVGIFLLGNVLAETIIASPKIHPQSLDASLIRTVFRLLGLIAGIITLILGIDRVGISIVPIIASVGIGGLAFALAARPTLENLIAGLILLTDRPVKVGEYCRFGDEEGTIVEIGLRSTRILSINGDLISIPNSQFSELKLANKSRRDRILLRQTIGLRYETTSDQLRFVLAKFREMILAHPKLLEQGARVRLIKYNDYSRDVEIFVYVDTGKLAEFLAIQEDVLLRVNDIVELSGTGFAFPSQTNYISQDSGLEPERSRAAEAEVKLWRSKGILPFPDLSTEQRDQFRDTLDFPPEGSPNCPPVSSQGNNSKEDEVISDKN